jgi:Trk K+ transport system NAD-binding subunit
VVGLITLVGLITIALSTYLILYSHQIYEFIAPALNIFERKSKLKEAILEDENSKNFQVIIFGLGRFGNRLAEMLDEHPEINYLGVDFDPNVIKQWNSLDRVIVYGDMEDPEILEHVPYENSKFIISTVADFQHSKQLIKALKRANYKGKVILTAMKEEDYNDLIKCGAEDVLRPHQMAATNFYNSYLKDHF